MCTVSINIDEAALREIRPDLNSTAAIRQWAQEFDTVDSMYQIERKLHRRKPILMKWSNYYMTNTDK